MKAIFCKEYKCYFHCFSKMTIYVKRKMILFANKCDIDIIIAIISIYTK